MRRIFFSKILSQIFIILIIFTLTLNFSDLIKKELNRIARQIEYYVFTKPMLDEGKLLDLISLDEDKVQDLYQMLKDVTEIFDIAGIRYTAHAGTLLGSIRNGGLIKWDDDIDLIILHEEEVKLTKLELIFDELGYYFTNNRMYKISKKSNKLLEKNSDYSYPYVDIMVFFNDSRDGIIKHVNPYLRKIFPLDWVSQDRFYPLKKCKFGQLSISCLNDHNWFLDNNFGKGWMDEAVVWNKHLQVKYHEKFKIKVDGEFAKPALPKYPLEDRVYLLKNKILDAIK